MTRRFFRKAAPEIGNSASLSDLSFILIVFFLAIAGFDAYRTISVELPNGETRKVARAEDILRCAIDAEGGITVRGEAVGTVGLRAAIEREIARRPNVIVVLSISPNAAWQSVVSAIQEARLTNAENFSFRMEDGPP